MKLLYLDAIRGVLAPLTEGQEEKLRGLYQVFAAMRLGQEERLLFLDTLIWDRRAPTSPQKADWGDLGPWLAKDLLSFSDLGGSSAELKAQVEGQLKSIKLEKGQEQFLRDWVDWENRMLERIGRPDLAVSEEDVLTELLKRAAALGLPLGALWAAGVTGFSAVGISTGLAALALTAPIPGLNAMTTGIVVLIALGISTKKGLDALLPTSKGEKQLEAMLGALGETRAFYLHCLAEDAGEVGKSAWWQWALPVGFRRRRADRDILQILKKELGAPVVAAFARSSAATPTQ